ncbi:hypothetical protein KFK09_006256 [Dendrobium nobile]|uniref:Uncharacterized protein n=1 Tax=Dendrobium nobile TaxID=94219 RepID=A0A8T3BQT6_DENNO|nr:hypothetical protein KFK09_006256 [Dendrobium nobile]
MKFPSKADSEISSHGHLRLQRWASSISSPSDPFHCPDTLHNLPFLEDEVLPKCPDPPSDVGNRILRHNLPFLFQNQHLDAEIQHLDADVLLSSLQNLHYLHIPPSCFQNPHLDAEIQHLDAENQHLDDHSPCLSPLWRMALEVACRRHLQESPPPDSSSPGLGLDFLLRHGRQWSLSLPISLWVLKKDAKKALQRIDAKSVGMAKIEGLIEVSKEVALAMNVNELEKLSENSYRMTKVETFIEKGEAKNKQTVVLEALLKNNVVGTDKFSLCRGATAADRPSEIAGKMEAFSVLRLPASV